MGIGSAAQRPELEIDVGPLGVDSVGHPSPGVDLGIVVDARDIGVSAELRADHSGFGDEEAAWDAGSLLVVFLDRVERDVLESARSLVMGAMAMRCLSVMRPTLRGVNSFDIVMYNTQG